MDSPICGTLRHEKRAIKLGELAHVINLATSKVGRAVWSGHAQEEKLTSFWYSRGCVPAQLLAHSFIERGKEFVIPGGRIQAVGLTQDVIVGGRIIGGAKTVKVVTRAALSPFESSIHGRWPLVYSPHSLAEPHIFTHLHMIQEQSSWV